jgi:hypothetical protein
MNKHEIDEVKRYINWHLGFKHIIKHSKACDKI